MWNTSRFPAHTDYVADLHEGYIPDVFVRTTANLDPAWGLMLYKELANRLRLDFTLSVRNDAWFLDATVFPVFSAPEAPGVSTLAFFRRCLTTRSGAVALPQSEASSLQLTCWRFLTHPRAHVLILRDTRHGYWSVIDNGDLGLWRIPGKSLHPRRFSKSGEVPQSKPFTVLSKQ